MKFTTQANPLRTILAEALIGLSLCAGAYFVLVEPAEAERRDLAERARSLGTPAPGAVRVSPAQAQSRLAEAGRLGVEAQARSRTARDEAAIFSGLMQEAARWGVTLEALQPAQARPRAAAPAGDATAAGEAPQDVVMAYVMTVNGPYDGVRRFVAAVPRVGGYTLVRGVRVSPVGEAGSQSVQALIETEHVAMDARALAPYTRYAGAPGAARTESPR